MLVAIVMAAVAAAGSAPAKAPAIVGLWRTPDDATVRIDQCGAAYCGWLVTSDDIAASPDLRDENNPAPGLRSRPLKDLKILSDLALKGSSWAGTIYDPDDGKTYGGTLAPSGADSLRLRGCAIPPFCRTEVWRRVRP